MTTIQAIATFENDTLTIISQPESGEVRRILKFTDAGIDMVMLEIINYICDLFRSCTIFRRCMLFNQMYLEKEYLRGSRCPIKLDV